MALVVDIAVHGIGRSEVTAVAKAFVNALESRVDFVEIDDRAFLEIRKLLDLCGLARRSTRNPDRAQVSGTPAGESTQIEKLADYQKPGQSSGCTRRLR